MPVTNTIQGSHLRDTRNPIRGFDLHKPTLDRVTRGHLTSARSPARRAANKDGRCSFAAIFAIMRATTAPWIILDALFLTSAFRLIILLCRPSLRLVSRLRDPRKLDGELGREPGYICWIFNKERGYLFLRERKSFVWENFTYSCFDKK